ncbi:hypothetical protein BDN72DRAFT_955361 [Pluteus cervinus]|uniref:Uncharacterized protein n=1 Tax=Pluteus cervinus TaxID=181527 RepID=A0ACD3B9L8_9AGAR|nr:hypothetical protein BDN72DRAFT_955361 [Pluteus cervinus]
MSTQPIIDYLTKQLSIERNIVTYRLLSRQFSIHVNTAKNELATYHKNAPYHGYTSYATYFLCGETVSGRPNSNFGSQSRSQALSSQSTDVDMYDVVDEEDGAGDRKEFSEEDEYCDSEAVRQVKMTLVNEKDLELALRHYVQEPDMHVYSLAPAPLIDGDLICGPTELVREVDNKNDKQYAIKIGKITAPNIDIKPLEPMKIRQHPSMLAGPSNAKPTFGGTSNLTTAPDKKAVKKEKEEAAIPKTKAPIKITADKPQEKGNAVPKKTSFFQPRQGKAKEEPAKKEVPKPKAEEVKPQEDSKPKIKFGPPRGVKRKTAVVSDSEREEPTKAEVKPSTKPVESSKPAVRVTRGVVLSDDDEEAEVKIKPSTRKAKVASVEAAESQRELDALMDVDDDEVIRVPRRISNHPRPATHKGKGKERDTEPEKTDASDVEEEPEPAPKEMDEDVEMEDPDDDDEPVVKRKTKRKPKKVVPVGKNGLKKKRVLKSRSKMDEKGYMVTEDYSSYESVDEEEAPPPPKVKAVKGKNKEKNDEGKSGKSEKPKKPLKPSKSEPATETEEDTPKPKPAATKATKQAKPLKASKSASGASKSQKSLASFFTAAPKKG